jgi:phosphoribosylanthranilate isomerase
MTRFKICCIQDRGEARLAVEQGAYALGLVSRMPSGPGPIPENRIAEIAAGVPPGIGTFLLTCKRDPAMLIEQQNRCRTGVLQLCAQMEGRYYESLRKGLPGVALVQVVHITGEEALEQARAAAMHADALLLDSGDPEAPVPELGGTGRTHDWRISRRIRQRVHVPILLAGGLTPANVASAIREVRPFAVDVCSGVRTDGKLDAEKLRAYVGQVRSADRFSGGR